MGMPGISVMLAEIAGRKDAEIDKHYGKVVKSITVSEKHIDILFEDATGIRIWDDGQSCCEHRYITCDDDAQALVGGKLTKIESKPADNLPEEYGEHQRVFIEIATDKGWITVCTHNEHNGYYGGFVLTVSELSAKEQEHESHIH